jgi:hypothetical protein
MDGLGSASPPVARMTTTGDGRSHCTWPHTFWFKPVSAFGLLDLTTFISSSPGLAMPSTLAPDRLGVGSRRIPSREIQPPEGEVTLSQELRTVRLLRPHVLVGNRWSYIGLCPGCKSSHNRNIRSFVSQLPQIRACPIKAHGSSCHVFATDGTLSGSLSPAEAGNAPTRDRIEPKASDGPVCDEKASASIFLWQHSGIAPAHWSYQ